MEPKVNVTATVAPDGTPIAPSVHADGGGQQPGGKVTFTPEQQRVMDAEIANRLRRQKAQFSDYADLKAKADRLVELEQAQLTELEQAQAQAAALELERDAALERANDRLIMAALTAEAAKQGLANPELAFTLADLAEVSITDDSAVVGVPEAVKALVQAYPYLIGRRTAPALDAGAGSGNRTSGDRQTRLTDEELAMAKNMGLTAEQYASGKMSRNVSDGSVATQINALRSENRQLRQRLVE